MFGSPIKTETKGIAGIITLNRPKKANAYTTEMIQDIDAALDKFVDKKKVRLIVFQGSEGYFCGGADLKEIKKRTSKDAFNLKSAALFDKIANCEKPTLAVIAGPAMGGGLELALACDVRIGTHNARFAFPETSLGIIPAAGGTFRLPQIAGFHLARQMILFGRTLDVWEAKDHGILAEVAAPENLAERVQHWIDMAGKQNPQAVALAKKAINMAFSEQAASFAEEAQAELYDKLNK